MAQGLPKKAGAACVLAVLAVLVVVLAPSPAAADCDFKPECRPGQTYRVPIPCEGKCSNFFQCDDGVATEKKCGSFFWRQKEFDPDTLECVRSTDCSWWMRVSSTSTASPSTSAPTTLPATTTPSTASSTPSSTEGTPTPTTTTPAQPPSSPSADPVTAAPSTATSTPTTDRPADSSSATPSAAAGLLLAALALLL